MICFYLVMIILRIILIFFCLLECLIEDQDALSNDTLYYVATLNQSLSCFEQYLVESHGSDRYKLS